jgi:predicted ATPase
LRLTRLYVRFFRSFNFDYERKASRNAAAKEWEELDGVWFPFVRVDLDPVVTAVVGANESGKSHLVEAIKQALTGKGIERSDFCRYSALFSVETGLVRTPDFGVEFELESEEDIECVSPVLPDAKLADRLTLLRLSDQGARLVDRAGEVHELAAGHLESIQAGLPAPFELETNVPLPDSISLDVLLGRESRPLSRRRRRYEFFDLFHGLPEITTETITNSTPQIVGLLEGGGAEAATDSAKITSDELGRKLLVDVARIDKSAFVDLENALREGHEGQAGGLIEEMNNSLARHLNFSRWWTQDRDFQLRLSPRERELVFTIRDRTGTDYSFGERSRGLTYFLSYFVQLRAHERPAGHEVLLMDEPDAYLSSIGQQDLLRALEDFARPDDGTREDQVIYVTHSPFLINKNAAQRLRVLDKGSNEEGTRVVRDVARNHYEPLRSAIGGFVAETAFVGGTNLLVEGLSDQVLLAGATTLLRHRGIGPRDLLDLNEVTIVPAGSASGVPYMAYLARGRDELKPACVALLDGDKAGRDAMRRLAHSTDGTRRPILDAQFVVDLAQWAEQSELKLAVGVEATEIEDLLSAQIAAEAARNYAVHLIEAPDEAATDLTPQLVLEKLAGEAKGRMWKAVELAFVDIFTEAHIDKVGFAKEVVRILEQTRDQKRRPDGLPDLEHNFQALLAELAKRLSGAKADEAERRSNRRTDRIVAAFLRDYPTAATRDAADGALREIEASVEGTVGDDAVLADISAMRREFELGSDALSTVPDFESYRARLGDLKTLRRLAYQPPEKSQRPAKSPNAPAAPSAEAAAPALSADSAPEVSPPA